MFSLPSVRVIDPLKLEPVEILSPAVNAQPSEPLPPLPVSLPGMPAPAYVTLVSNQPLRPLALSIPDPGAAIQQPVMPVELTIFRSKFATATLRKANVKYCECFSRIFGGPGDVTLFVSFFQDLIVVFRDFH